MRLIFDKAPKGLTLDLFRRLSGALLCISLLWPLSARAEDSIKFGYNQWIGSAGLFIAMEEKLFEKNGLKVEFTEFAGPGDGIAAVMAGKLDGVATTTDNVIVIADSVGTDKVTQVYFSDTSYGGDAMIAKDGYESIEDLRGKTIAASIGQVSHLLLNKALATVGMTDADVNLVNMDGETAGAAYVAGQLDAAVTWEPWLSKGKRAGGSVVFSSADAPNLILDSIMFNSALAKAKPDSVKAFLASIDQGDQLLKSDPQKAQTILANFLNVSVDDVKEMLGGVRFYSMQRNRELFASGELIEASAEVKQFLIERQVISKDFDIAPLFDPSYLQ